MPLISCRNVTIKYDGRPAVDNVSFDVEPGDYLAIVGENGSGKSTLIKGLLGLLSPAAGTIIFEGLKQTQIGYLPQHMSAQRDFPASVYEVVLSGCLNSCGVFGFYTKKEKRRALEAIERLGLVDVQRKCYRELSGGQQKRVLLARALCATKKLLLLDEPAAGLDPMMMGELYAVINALVRESGITVIMVSHDISGVLKDSSKVLHMNTRSGFFGTTEEYQKTDVYRRMAGEAYPWPS